MATEADDMSMTGFPDGDLRARIVYIEHKTQDHKSRLAAIEKWVADTNVSTARRDEQWTNMLSRLNSIDGNIKWVTRLILGGIIAAVMAFVVGGGLNLR